MASSEPEADISSAIEHWLEQQQQQKDIFHLMCTGASNCRPFSLTYILCELEHFFFC